MKSYITRNEQCKLQHYFFAKKIKALMIGLTIGIGMLGLGCCYYYYNNRDYPRQNIIEHNKNYGILASLSLAHHYTNEGNYAAAERHLQKTISKVREENLRALINLRLAQLQLQQSNMNGALQTLDRIKQKGWIVLADNIRGDAQLIKGNHQAARAAYEKVLLAKPPQELQKLICLKLNNLSIREGSNTIESNICGPVSHYST